MSYSTQATDERYHFVISGGGPAGLCAAITAARKGLDALVLEVGHRPAPRPRGEGVNAYSLFKRTLGEDFFDRECYRMDGGTVFHSPGDLRQVRIPGRRPLFFFEWRTFIDRLELAAEEAGVEIVTQARVLAPIRGPRGTYVGVEYRDSEGETRKVYGNAIFGCDGHQSAVGRHFSIPYGELNCPMVKCLAQNCNVDVHKTPDLQFYLIGHGDVPHNPSLPPCVLYAFPIGGRKMELGLMLRTMHLEGLRPSARIPTGPELWETWQQLKKSYPGFNRYFEGAELTVEEATALPNVRMVKNYVPAPGVVLIGDSAGFVDPFGSSGLYFGMSMAETWANALAERIIAERGQAGVLEDNSKLWTPHNIKAYKSTFEKTRAYRHIRLSYRKLSAFEWYVFKHRRSAERINRRWRRISALFRMA